MGWLSNNSKIFGGWCMLGLEFQDWRREFIVFTKYVRSYWISNDLSDGKRIKFQLQNTWTDSICASHYVRWIVKQIKHSELPSLIISFPLFVTSDFMINERIVKDACEKLAYWQAKKKKSINPAFNLLYQFYRDFIRRKI